MDNYQARVVVAGLALAIGLIEFGLILRFFFEGKYG